MTELENYFLSQYRITKWPFFSHVKVLNHFKKEFGVNVQTELDSMIADRKIRYRPSVNGQLIEMGSKLINQS